MGYTLSFVADTKCTKYEAGGLVHHDARDVDLANGCEVEHSNEDIDPARTHLNTTVVTDGKGGWIPCTDTQQITAALAARLAHVKKPLRKDAVVMRPFLLQLDPEWYKEHTDTGERVDAEQHMMDWAVDTFGADNILYVSIHEDEGSRHLHVGFCPVTDDGRLAQKDWFPSPSDLRKKHDEFRQHMRDAGYDVAKERKKPGKHARRMSVEEYKDFARLQGERRDVEQQQEQLEADKQQLHADRLNARAEAQRIRQQAQNAGAVYIENARATAAAAEDEATEYEAKRHKAADDDAAQIRRDAEADAAKIRADAQLDAQKIVTQANAQADAALAAVRLKIQQEIDDAREQLETDRKAAQAALQGDLATWGGLTPKPTANALLGVLGAAVEASREKPPASTGVGRAWEQLQRMMAERNAKSGPAAVEEPTR